LGDGNRLTADLAQQAFTMALHHRAPKAGLLHHLDRGSQYAATAYRLLLATYDITKLDYHSPAEFEARTAVA
jgi:putative transposase